MVDPAHLEAGVQRVPGRALVSVQHSARGKSLAHARNHRLLGRRHPRQGATAALAQGHHDLPFARAALGQAPVHPVGHPVLRPHMAAEEGAVDLGDAALAAKLQPLQAGRHRLAQLVRQHERRLVLHPKIADGREHALALHLVADQDGRQ